MSITPIAICLEDLDAPAPDQRFLQCVALVGRQPGLRLDARGAVRWLVESDDGAPPAVELWVSQDGRLILYRPSGAEPARVERDGRALDVPADKPVVLIDGDRVDVGGRRLRIHVHGETTTVAPPSVLPVEAADSVTSAPAAGRPEAGHPLLHAAAAALAIGAAVGASGCPGKVEVRDDPPAAPIALSDAGARAPRPDLSPARPDLRPIPQHSVKKQPGPPIEVRVRPPEMPAAPAPRPRPDAPTPAPPDPPKGE